ncbi:hypothetical protein EVAR_73988_1 [Eumeta japonica]|uniref:Uncharacterized protein n=1 Tax=Eumeta variegata TaxID=151549 RepID=A0A4C1SWK1_EUMVA|nr:hypothetical protein EVAR_73988_1 [Eumeta japonica]
MAGARKRDEGCSCIMSEEVDNEYMVQCDACDEWFHYDCAGVGRVAKCRHNYALLDEGSSITLLEEETFNLGAHGRKENLCLKWTSEKTRLEENSLQHHLKFPVHKVSPYKLQGVRTVKNLSLHTQTLDAATIKNRLRRNILNESITPTKREILRVLMSIYDPLGFVSCYPIETWRSGINWDDELTTDLAKVASLEENLALATGGPIPKRFSSGYAWILEMDSVQNEPSRLYYEATTRMKIDMWIHGPEFLLTDKDKWPQCSDLGTTNVEEMRAHVLNFHVPLPAPLNTAYFSDWKRLYRALATLRS